MRQLFTTRDALAAGLTWSQISWGEKAGRWRRVCNGVYGRGPEDPSDLDRMRARVVARDAVARGTLAGVLHGLDGVSLDDRPLRRRQPPPERVEIVGGTPCADPLQTMIDLASVLDDLTWEQALESALRKQRLKVEHLEQALPALGRSRTPGTKRIRRVLALRPFGAAPTGSLLETLFVQLARDAPGLPAPVRQLTVVNAYGDFVARVDLAWPWLGFWVELDGQQHRGQPVYDASRQTAVVAVTGWLCGRFTWTEVVNFRRVTVSRLVALAEQARRRPVAP